MGMEVKIGKLCIGLMTMIWRCRMLKVTKQREIWCNSLYLNNSRTMELIWQAKFFMSYLGKWKNIICFAG